VYFPAVVFGSSAGLIPGAGGRAASDYDAAVRKLLRSTQPGAGPVHAPKELLGRDASLPSVPTTTTEAVAADRARGWGAQRSPMRSAPVGERRCLRRVAAAQHTNAGLAPRACCDLAYMSTRELEFTTTLASDRNSLGAYCGLTHRSGTPNRQIYKSN
jgi:hypothetical protein